MSILLDTHAALWYALGDTTLSLPSRAAIDNETALRCISPASYWEIAIKVSLGKYSLTVPFQEFWADVIARCGYTILPIEVRHAEMIITLPHHHRDPFDRMLIAQALVEGLPIVSCDMQLEAYGVRRIW